MKNKVTKIIVLILFLLTIPLVYIYILSNFIKNNFYNFNENSPTIFSKIIDIDINNNFNINKFLKILELSRYKESDKLYESGNYILEKNRIFIFRRSFYSFDNYIKKAKFLINFNNNKILNIINLDINKEIKNFQIEPQIIYFSNLNNNFYLYKFITDFPDSLIKIILLVEDENFFFHKGININSILRSVIKNIKNRKIVQGGSTITQQLVKNIFFNYYNKNFIRKFNEILISLIIENKYKKDYILEFYLNKIFFGNINNNNIYGFPLASLFYFGKNIDELDLNEQVILVSMIKGPSLYNPYKNKKIIIDRRNFIFKKMKDKNLIDNYLFDKLISKDIILNNYNIYINYSYLDIIKNEIKKLNKNFYDFKYIFSNFDLLSQNSSKISCKKILSNLREKTKIKDLEISMLITDFKNGNIKCSIGSFDNKFGYNRIYINRNIGSIIKPIIYLLSLIKKKYKLNSLIDNKNVIYNDGKKIWIPKNLNNNFKEKVIFIDSLIHSLNIPVINIGFSVGIDNIINFIKLILNDYNIDIKKYPSIFLGSIGLNLINISQIYQSIFNYGNIVELNSISFLIDKKDIKYNFQNQIRKENNIFSEEHSYLIMYCMKKIIEEGTAKNLNKNKDLVLLGKTGTTNNFVDSWFIGSDNNEMCIIWIGRDNNCTTYLSGSSGSMKIYEEYIKYSFPESFYFKELKNIYYVNIDEYGNIICSEHNKKIIPIIIDNEEALNNNFLCPHHNIIVKYFNKIFNIKKK
ncbi:transglycosylase domain-containing protein [endosymbiont of Euscepes postfasciatus]|uniref:transglycosylase domain-containing protein n=1 Tax=endosymbiont of Euscepes postfasciatus TaxID=650377 RepID=UPI001559B652|nr:transglycosylase domain-containing protein [endosymbiont of Euscepes postfasciatus]